MQKYIPVLSFVDNKPLMPTTPAKARWLVKNKQATPFFGSFGLYCIRLKDGSNYEPKIFPIVLTIDPGSKKEAYAIKSAEYTYLNIECDAIDWVSDNLEVRRNMRRGRRFRKTPCRQPRWANRGTSLEKGRLPPSTRARWTLKLEIIKKLTALFPIAFIVCEEIKAKSIKGNDRRNKSFSPLEQGKKWFSEECSKFAQFKWCSGWKTSRYRQELELEKTDDKMSGKWSAHCVDTFAMATKIVGGQAEPDNREMLYLSPLNLSRRSLHRQQYAKGGKRPRAGGTKSLGFTRGSIVKLLKPTKATIIANPQSIFRIGGYDEKSQRLSLCTIDGSGKDNGRVIRTVKPEDVKFITYNKFKIKL